MCPLGEKYTMAEWRKAILEYAPPDPVPLSVRMKAEDAAAREAKGAGKMPKQFGEIKKPDTRAVKCYDEVTIYKKESRPPGLVTVAEWMAATGCRIDPKVIRNRLIQAGVRTDQKLAVLSKVSGKHHTHNLYTFEDITNAASQAEKEKPHVS